MNEFTAKKLGEVLAFSRLGVELFERGKEALASTYGAERCQEVTATMKEHAQKVEATAEAAGVSETTLPKAEATTNKLRGMMEAYIGDEWDNAAELLEWSGFFWGAGMVHWAIVGGAAESLNDEDLKTLAETGKTTHHDLLHEARDAIAEIGKQKAA